MIATKKLNGTLKHSEETKKKMSLAQMGEKNHRYGKTGTMLGKHHTDATKNKISLAKKGKAHIGYHWYNNRHIQKQLKECPDGFVKGRLKYE